MKFSVIVSAYAGDLHLLARCLFGVAAQEYRDFETIVTIKADPVAFNDATRRCLGITPVVDFIRCDNNDTLGHRERAVGLAIAKGEYVVWLSADNLVLPG